MSLYHYFESLLNENPEVLVTRASNVYSYDDLSKYFRNRVLCFKFRKLRDNLRNISICYTIVLCLNMLRIYKNMKYLD